MSIEPGGSAPGGAVQLKISSITVQIFTPDFHSTPRSYKI
jgi:hypothetical protein